MSENSRSSAPASSLAAPVARSGGRWILPAALTAALAALAGCGPDTGPGATSEASAAPSAGATAAASATKSGAPPISSKPASLAAASEAPACPKLVRPNCPVAQAPQAPAPLSKASHRLWARHRGGRHAHLYDRREHREESQVDRYAESGYQIRERSSESDRLVVRREGFGPACPRACPGHRDWDFAGIDARGYLVWPGKVEY